MSTCGTTTHSELIAFCLFLLKEWEEHMHDGLALVCEKRPPIHRCSVDRKRRWNGLRNGWEDETLTIPPAFPFC